MLQRQPHREARTFPNPVRLCLDASLVKLCQLLNQGQSDSHSALLTNDTRISLAKDFKHVWQKLRSDALAAVFHDNHSLAVLFNQTDADLASGGSELACVID